jgi:hypothetical protein
MLFLMLTVMYWRAYFGVMANRSSMDEAATVTEKTQPTTIRLPGTVLEQAKELLASGVPGITTMSGLVAGALEAYMNMVRKEQIDHAFLRAAKDVRYQTLSREVNALFATTDRETISVEKKRTVESQEKVAASMRNA